VSHISAKETHIIPLSLLSPVFMYGSRALLLQSGDPSRNGASTLLHPDPGFGNATSILTSVTMPCTVKSSAQGYSLSSEIRKKDGKCLDLEIEIMTYELRPPLLGLQKKDGKCLDLVIEIMKNFTTSTCTSLGQLKFN